MPPSLFKFRCVAWGLALLLLPVFAGCEPTGAARRPRDDTDGPTRVSHTRAEFEQMLDRWKMLLGELHQLELAFYTSHRSQRDDIAEQYYSKLEDGFELEAELLESALRTFVADPEENDDLRDFLITISSQLIAAEYYEDGLRISQSLIENQIEDAQVYNNAAKAAFACNEFGLADQYLRILTKSEGRESSAKRRLRLLPTYRQEWQRERKLRETEQLAADLPRVLLRTERGDMELELFENEAPNTVANFMKLVEQGFYDNLTFHRVVSEFAALGGDPHADGSGSPGYYIPHELERPDRRLHFRGSLCTVSEGLVANGCQFCLTFQPTPQLDGQSTVFGRVVRGIEVLARLQRIGVGLPSKSIQADRILEARVLRKRNHKYAPQMIPDPGAEQREENWKRMRRLLSR